MKILLSLILSIAIVSIGITAYAQNEQIPEWIKNTAGYWSNDEINDSEFFNLIQFLIDKEIINIPNTQDDTEKVNELTTELNQIKRNSVKDIQNAYNDGYEKALSENRITGTISPNYDSCDEQREKQTLIGLASLGITNHVWNFIPDDGSTSSEYWDYWLSEWHSYYLNQLPDSDPNCAGTATSDELYMLGLVQYLIIFDLTVDELCSDFSNDGTGRVSYEECYDIFQPIEDDLQ